MNKLMCKAAWGSPYEKFKTTTTSIEREQWLYNWKCSLYFESGILVKIEN